MTSFPIDLSGMTLVIIKPDEGVSTREAYAGVHPCIPAVPLAERLQCPVSEWQHSVTNAFESSVFAAHPVIRAAKERLLAAGAVYAAMSGSGSAVFGLFDGRSTSGDVVSHGSPDEKGESLHRLSPYVFAL